MKLFIFIFIIKIVLLELISLKPKDSKLSFESVKKKSENEILTLLLRIKKISENQENKKPEDVNLGKRCLDFGSNCNIQTESCCFGSCRNEKCTCLPNQNPCKSSQDCCSSNCKKSICSKSSSSDTETNLKPQKSFQEIAKKDEKCDYFTSEGKICDEGLTCIENVCTEELKEGEICSSDENCNSNLFCKFDPELKKLSCSSKTCQIESESCNISPSPELKQQFPDIAESQLISDCCDGFSCLDLKCKKCKKTKSSDKDTEAKCSEDAECCSKVCTDGLCQKSCNSKNEKCNSKVKCCGGLECSSGVCVDRTCYPLEESCKNKALECCEGICFEGFCKKITCYPYKGECSDNKLSCCEGNECINEICETKKCYNEDENCTDKKYPCCDGKCIEGRCGTSKKLNDKCNDGKEECEDGLKCQESKCCVAISAPCKSDSECCDEKLCLFGKCCYEEDCNPCYEEKCEIDEENQKEVRPCCDKEKICSKHRKCEAKGKPGDECYFDFQCDNENCANGKCGIDKKDDSCKNKPCNNGICCSDFICTKGVCRERKGEFSECSGSECQVGLDCIASKDGKYRCGDLKHPLEEGQSCYYFDKCDKDLTCWKGKCFKCLGENKRCDSMEDDLEGKKKKSTHIFHQLTNLGKHTKIFNRFLMKMKKSQSLSCCEDLFCIYDPSAKSKKKICSSRMRQPCINFGSYCEVGNFQTKCCKGTCCNSVCINSKVCNNEPEMVVQEGNDSNPQQQSKGTNNNFAKGSKKDSEDSKQIHIRKAKSKLSAKLKQGEGNNETPQEGQQNSGEQNQGNEGKSGDTKKNDSPPPNPPTPKPKGSDCDTDSECEQPLKCISNPGELKTICEDPKGRLWSPCSSNADCKDKMKCVNFICSPVGCLPGGSKCEADPEDCCDTFKCRRGTCYMTNAFQKGEGGEGGEPSENNKGSEGKRKKRRFLKAVKSLKRFTRQNYNKCGEENEVCKFNGKERNCCSGLSCLWNIKSSFWTCSEDYSSMEYLIANYKKVITQRNQVIFSQGKLLKLNTICADLNDQCEYKGRLLECCNNNICVPEFPSGKYTCKHPASFHNRLIYNISIFSQICTLNGHTCDPSLKEQTYCCESDGMCLGSEITGYRCQSISLCVSQEYGSCENKPCCKDLKCLQGVTEEGKICFPSNSPSGSQCLDDNYCKADQSCFFNICTSNNRVCKILNEGCNENQECCPGYKCKKRNEEGKCKKKIGIRCEYPDDCFDKCNSITGTCGYKEII